VQAGGLAVDLGARACSAGQHCARSTGGRCPEISSMRDRASTTSRPRRLILKAWNMYLYFSRVSSCLDLAP
jgi:hypothetical protein